MTTYFLIFFIGLAVGSFLNVVICRLQTQEGIVAKRSHCPKCGQVLRWYDLVPIASFFILRRRCRDCGKPISWQYPLVEIATGILFVLAAHKIFNFKFFPTSSRILDGFAIGTIFNQFLNFRISQFLSLIFWLFIISCLIVIFVYDLRYYIIPDKIIYPAIIVAVLFRVFGVLNFGHWNLFGIWDLPARQASQLAGVAGGGFEIWRPLFFYLLAGIGATAFFLALVLITRGRGMGVGDVKLAFLMGLLLGWPNILIALLLAFSGGALIGLGLIAAKQKTLKSQIPFGPFLISGTLAAFFFGSAIISWYFSFFL